MFDKIKQGMTAQKEKIVKYEETAAFIGSGGLEVFSTPSLVAFFELTSKDLIDPLLPEGFSTVGIEICVKHLKPTAVGKKVFCNVKIEKIDGKKIFISGEMFDEEGKIGEGTHKRYIVNNEEFLKKIK